MATVNLPELRFASWWRRVVARLIDVSLWFVPLALLAVGLDLLTNPCFGLFGSSYLGVQDFCSTDTYFLNYRYNNVYYYSGEQDLLLLLGLASWSTVTVMNKWVLQGRRGFTVGKLIVGIRLVGVRTGEAPGIEGAATRSILHIVDLISVVGFLRPLWHRQQATFADSMVESVVVVSDYRTVSVSDGISPLWRRLLAHAVDSFLYPLAILIWALNENTTRTSNSCDDPFLGASGMGGVPAVSDCYDTFGASAPSPLGFLEPVFDHFFVIAGIWLLITILNKWVLQGWTGRTVGKAILGIALVDAETMQPLRSAAVNRWFVQGISRICWLVNLLVLRNSLRQDVGDLHVNSIVVKKSVMQPRVQPSP